jgi:rhamnogalacturonyl hydrolase YesR
MQIKFLTLYHNFKDEEYNKSQAQYELLNMWQRSLTQRNIKFIKKAAVMFQAYSFIEYPDQEKLINEIKAVYGHKDKKTKAIEYWWGGERYPDFDTLFTALAEQKRLMELTIEVKE